MQGRAEKGVTVKQRKGGECEYGGAKGVAKKEDVGGLGVEDESSAWKCLQNGRRW